MPEEQFVLEVLEKTIGPMLLIMLFSLAGSLFLALCVYNDAKARGNDNAVMWAVLSGFFRGGNADWTAQATSYFNIIKSGFANYAEENNFIYNDYTKVAEQTNNLVNSPYSSVS